MDGRQRVVGVLEKCFSLVENFLNDKRDVVFAYVIRQKDITRLCQRFPNTKIKVVVLLADEATLRQRDEARPHDERLGDRAIVCFNEMKAEHKDSPYVLDTTELSVKDVVEKILGGRI